mmetsp:Transcript_11695/g.16397  ORF Transcript_11695/g.16397 Transcript_11695/m.16397 type:complete len:257 (+) Transcript_11695:175-945(+)
MASTQTQREEYGDLATDKFLKQWRNKTQEYLSSECCADALNFTVKSASLDFVMKSVRALIATNREIWERCEKHKIPGAAQTFQMKKYCYQKAYCYQRAFLKTSQYCNITKITTELNVITQDFGSLPEIPDYLTNIVPPPKDKDSVIPDYNAYLGKSAILHDNVLNPFLQKFQKHLEEVQVFLGSIEEWLLEAEQTATFLNNKFSKELKIGIVRRNPIEQELFNTDKAGDSINMTFDLTTESGKGKLNALVDLLKMY